MWAGSDFNGANAPASLDGIGVTVNGRPAFIYYISPTQININTPEDTTIGPVTIQVRTPLGLSNTVTANRTRLSPTLQTVPQFNVGGKQHVVALRPDFATFIGLAWHGPRRTLCCWQARRYTIHLCIGMRPHQPAGAGGRYSRPGIAVDATARTQNRRRTGAGNIRRDCGWHHRTVSIQRGDPLELIVDGVSNDQNLVIVIGE